MAKKGRDFADSSEWNFFPLNNSHRDVTDMQIIADYEYARESDYIAAFTKELDASERTRHHRRCEKARLQHLPQFITEVSKPLVPLVCVLANQFPTPWMKLSQEVQRSLCRSVEKVYQPRSMPAWRFPLPDEESSILQESANADGATLHVFAISITALSRCE